ncbi:major facilitator superfamily domain-containing protein [Calycina marina]|uniref:Major facilitator superfamily domain-containing protein n=1 Tax=Calycina marina TaxID=1763456 RepID=A0A9P7Z277_9HELO|nr:major facilitator superfamily domain-containing protein [Calycina marina]
MNDHNDVSPHTSADDGRPWGAQNSLRRNARLVKNNASDEVTPLLSDGASPLGDDTTHEWEGADDFVGVPLWNKPSLFWLLPAFSLFSLAFGGIIVPKLNLILSLVCREYLFDRASTDPTFTFASVILETENAQCRIPEVQALVTKFMLFMVIIPGILSAIMAPRLGSMSDRYGRKRFMVLSSSGLFCAEVITILVAKYPDTLDYRWLLAGAIFDGLTGSFTVGMALTHAYAADCTAPPKRGVAFGYFHACLFTGIALGPLVAAFIIKAFGEILIVFYIALVIHTCFMLFVAFVVPESLSKKRQILARERYARDGGTWAGYNSAWALKKLNILEPLKILRPTGLGTSSRLRANLLLLAMVDTIIFGVAMGAVTVTVYYMGYQFGWGTAQTSMFIFAVNSTRVTCLVLILPVLNYFVRTRPANKQRRQSGFAIPEKNSGSDNLDLNIIRGAIFFELLGFLGYALARRGEVFVVAGIVTALGGVGSPTLQSALTKHVPHDRVGQLLGATGLLHSLARVVAPLVFNLIYAGTVDTFPQTVFVVLALCFGLALLASFLIRPHIYLEDIDETTGNPPRSNTSRGGEDLANEEIGGC